MIINFCIRGRLGNAIFRYMASAIMCILYNGTYAINNLQDKNITDNQFSEIIKNIINKKHISVLNNSQCGINLTDFYQHDLIYKIYKHQIINFISNNPEHYVLTDGVNAGDTMYEKFYMTDIINTPIIFNKKYKNVMHIRLEDFVTHSLYLKVDRYITLLDKGIISDLLCIVCKKPMTGFEKSYIQEIIDYAINKKIQIFLEHNDTITDFYIMKEAETLICSNSTLSWCAAFFSDKIQTCYFPDYDITSNSTCKYPIDNTILY